MQQETRRNVKKSCDRRPRSEVVIEKRTMTGEERAADCGIKYIWISKRGRKGLYWGMDGKDLVLVTGGTGFVGARCIIELMRKGYRVRTTIREIGRSGELRTVIARAVGGTIEIIAADLNNDAPWPNAIKGCRYVLHVASPLPPKQPKNPEALIAPARGGTLRVLQASLEAKVERVVLTSSLAAMAYPRGAAPDVVTEAFWTDPEHPWATPYIKSKALAESAAWDFVQAHGRTDMLTAIAPSTILGPVLTKDISYSVLSVARMLDGSIPAIPRLGFNFVDVRDVAEAQVRAMTTREAGGQRYLVSGEFHWLEDIAAILRESLGKDAKRVPRARAPDFMVKLIARFNPELRAVIHELGQQRTVSSEKARQTFGWSPRPFQKTVVDCATSLIWAGAA